MKFIHYKYINGDFMSPSEIVIIILTLGMIIGGILLLKKSAKKFDLTPKQLEKIKKRNNDLDKADEEN